MKYVRLNNERLKQQDINSEVIRVKAIIINSKGQLLIGKSFGCYQLIGGHLEQDETLVNCLIREVKEESGIILQPKDVVPFLLIDDYYKDYPSKDKNFNSRIYYFIINTDQTPNISNTSYTVEENIGKFSLEYLDLDGIESVIKQNVKEHIDATGIAKTLLIAIREYKKMTSRK